VIDLKTRQDEIAGIVASPDGSWMSQIARSWSDCDNGFFLGSRYPIHDRDPLSTRAFDATPESAGIHPVKLPVRSPIPDAHAERIVRSIKSECLDQIIAIGEGHLRRLCASTSITTTTSEITEELGIAWVDRRAAPFDPGAGRDGTFGQSDRGPLGAGSSMRSVPASSSRSTSLSRCARRIV
jgi:hypothetical protein